MLRSFIAVELAPEVIRNIAAAIDELQPRLPAVRWVAQTNFHLTLKFLDSIRDDQVDAIHATLAHQLRPFSPCIINARGVGVFPGPKRPRILWVGVKKSSELGLLAAQIETALTPLGFPPETRDFKAHLTIGRWRDFGRAARDLAGELEGWHSAEFGSSKVDTVILFQSVLKPGGAEYRRLRTIPLAGEQQLVS